MTKKEKVLVEVVEALCDYYPSGTRAIENAHEIFSSECPGVSYDAFHDALDIREIDDIGFMYSTDRETYASNAAMLRWAKATFGAII